MAWRRLLSLTNPGQTPNRVFEGVGVACLFPQIVHSALMCCALQHFYLHLHSLYACVPRPLTTTTAPPNLRSCHNSSCSCSPHTISFRSKL